MHQEENYFVCCIRCKFVIIYFVCIFAKYCKEDKLWLGSCRSQCFSKLGEYAMADKDADAVLRINPTNVRGLLNKAEMQYNLGNFEHSMKFFHRFAILPSKAIRKPRRIEKPDWETVLYAKARGT